MIKSSVDRNKQAYFTIIESVKSLIKKLNNHDSNTDTTGDSFNFLVERIDRMLADESVIYIPVHLPLPWKVLMDNYVVLSEQISDLFEEYDLNSDNKTIREEIVELLSEMVEVFEKMTENTVYRNPSYFEKAVNNAEIIIDLLKEVRKSARFADMNVEGGKIAKILTQDSAISLWDNVAIVEELFGEIEILNDRYSTGGVLDEWYPEFENLMNAVSRRRVGSFAYDSDIAEEKYKYLTENSFITLIDDLLVISGQILSDTKNQADSFGFAIRKIGTQKRMAGKKNQMNREEFISRMKFICNYYYINLPRLDRSKSLAAMRNASKRFRTMLKEAKSNSELADVDYYELEGQAHDIEKIMTTGQPLLTDGELKTIKASFTDAMRNYSIRWNSMPASNIKKSSLYNGVPNYRYNLSQKVSTRKDNKKGQVIGITKEGGTGKHIYTVRLDSSGDVKHYYTNELTS